MKKFKYQLALFLVHIMVAIIISSILTLICYVILPNYDYQNKKTTMVIAVFSIIGTAYVFKKGLVWIYPSNGDG
ncbi:hypothetical protein [Neobacillus dielmonensis]|uniref:hypothetical protein n=1 Tax=Neobacillus dielmonensis TaxID=1347369 RepID=UPI0005AB21D7|nr:hypothetical protein [Neobacillus dielmonensis]